MAAQQAEQPPTAEVLAHLPLAFRAQDFVQLQVDHGSGSQRLFTREH
jgi:hypothetical protein